jgi:hypothetical protein
MGTHEDSQGSMRHTIGTHRVAFWPPGGQRFKSCGEPMVHLRQQLVRFGTLALPLPQSAQAH